MSGLGGAVWLCWILALSAVALAFLGPDRAGALMGRFIMQLFMASVAVLLAINGLRVLKRKRFDSALSHLGCACVLAGWLIGCHAERTTRPENPVTGAMAMIDGDESDKLWEGAQLTRYVGRLPFRVKLEKFMVEYYDATDKDRDAGRMPPVREYRSRVTLTEPGTSPYVANVRVNHPVKACGYHIYQMSWGQSQDTNGRPVTYTVLQFIRDPGLSVVYAGFIVLFAGILLFAVRVFRGKPAAVREVAL